MASGKDYKSIIRDHSVIVTSTLLCIANPSLRALVALGGGVLASPFFWANTCLAAWVTTHLILLWSAT